MDELKKSGVKGLLKSLFKAEAKKDSVKSPPRRRTSRKKNP